MLKAVKLTGRISVVTLFVVAIASARAEQPPLKEVSTEHVAANSRGTFIPSGGYKRTVDVLRFERMVQREAGRALGPRPRPTALAGVRNIPVILLSFANRPSTSTPAQFEQLLFSDPPAANVPAPMTMSQYFRDASSGRFDVRGSVLGWYTLPKNDEYYENNLVDRSGRVVYNNGSGKPFGELLQVALSRADHAVDFSQFDNDGPDGRANSGDDDGKVDTVLLIHSEAGGECGGTSLVNIWSHSGHYSDTDYGHSGPYETRAIRRDSLGREILKSDGSPERIVIDDYTIQPGLACADANTPPRLIDIGVICHEYGHALGLPDLYDRTPSSNPDSSGVGNYCLMGTGSYGGDNVHTSRPVLMSAWARAFLGWASLQRIGDGQLTFEPALLRGKAYWFDVPSTNGKEYFLVEYRVKGLVPPAGRVNWDADIPESGLAIWHVDERVGELHSTWPFAPYDQGQNDAPSLPSPGGNGFAATHSLVALIQADAKLELESAANRFSSGDLWQSAHDFRDDPACVAGTRGYDGKRSGLRLHSINLASGTLSASSSDFDPTVTLAAAAPLPAASAAPARVGSVPERDDFNVRDTLQPLPTRPSTSLAAEHSMTTSKTDLDGALDELLKKNRSAEVRIIYDPGQKWIKSITGLTVPRRGDTRMAASQLLRVEMPELAGSLDLSAAPSSETGTRFEQSLKIAGETLPLFGHGAVVHYGGRYLKAITTDLVDPAKLIVTGSNTALTAEAAKMRVAQLLTIDTRRITAVREGIHLVDRDPANARVAYEVSVDAGPGKVPILVFVDEQTREVLDIR